MLTCSFWPRPTAQWSGQRGQKHHTVICFKGKAEGQTVTPVLSVSIIYSMKNILTGDCQQVRSQQVSLSYGSCHHQDTGSFKFYIKFGKSSNTSGFPTWSACAVVRKDLKSSSLTYGPTLGLSWLMCSLAPISPPQALTINPGWLLIGAEGIQWGPITGCLPEPPQLQQAYLLPCLCTVIGQMESIRMKGIGGLITDLSRSHTRRNKLIQ